MPFTPFDKEKAAGDELVALSADERLAASGDYKQPLIGAAMAVAGIAFRAAGL